MSYRERLNAKRRAEYAKNPEVNLAYQRKIYQKNKAKKIAYQSAYYAKTKDKINEERRILYATDPDYRQKIILKNKANRHGITVEEYLELYRQTDGRCKVCGNRPSERGLHVDHDHKTGVIRGLLCHHCNTALGLVRENPDILKKLIEYIS